jgi:hypothetical protein
MLSPMTVRCVDAVTGGRRGFLCPVLRVGVARQFSFLSRANRTQHLMQTERNMWHHTSKTTQTASWKEDSTPPKKIFLHGNLECATIFENSTMATKTAVSSLLDDIHVSGDRGYLRVKRAGGKFTRIKIREWTRCRELGPRIHVGNIPHQQLFIIKSPQVSSTNCPTENRA